MESSIIRGEFPSKKELNKVRKRLTKLCRTKKNIELSLKKIKERKEGVYTSLLSESKLSEEKLKKKDTLEKIDPEIKELEEKRGKLIELQKKELELKEKRKSLKETEKCIKKMLEFKDSSVGRLGIITSGQDLLKIEENEGKTGLLDHKPKLQMKVYEKEIKEEYEFFKETTIDFEQLEREKKEESESIRGLEEEIEKLKKEIPQGKRKKIGETGKENLLIPNPGRAVSAVSESKVNSRITLDRKPSSSSICISG